MKQNDRQLKKYYSDIRLWLPCPGKEKREILRQIKANVQDYLSTKPDATMADVQQHFGTADIIASAYIDNMDRTALLKKLRIRRTIKRIVLAVAAAMILLWGCVVGWAAYEEWKNTHGYQTTVTQEFDENGGKVVHSEIIRYE